MPPSANGNSTSEPAAPRASNPTRRQLFNVVPCGRKIAARPTSAAAAAINTSRISESPWAPSIARIASTRRSAAAFRFAVPSACASVPARATASSTRLLSSLSAAVRASRAASATARLMVRLDRSGEIGARGRQLCSDFLMQAGSQRVERAMQPLVKFHRSLCRFDHATCRPTVFDYTAPTSIGTVI